MNLFVSGNLTEELRASVMALSRPSNYERLHTRALRLEDVDDSLQTRHNVNHLCKREEVDHAYLPNNLKWSNFRVLAMDMDSTLISIECIDEIAALSGRGDQISQITEATMQGSILDFSDSLRKRVALLEGVSTSVLEDVYTTKLRVNEGAQALLTAARSNGLKTALVSGGFDYFSTKLCKLLNIDFALANALITSDRILTGKVAEPIVDGAAKAAFVKELLMRQGAPTDAAIVIGDGANDIDMMQSAGLSIAYRAKDKVREYASCEIRYGPLSTVLDWISS